MSPALTGRFLTTEPLEKSERSFESTFPRGVGVRVTEGRSCVAEAAVGAPPPPPPSGLAHCSPSAVSLLFLLHNYYYLFGCMACGILFSQPGIEPMPPAGEAQSPNHWAAKGIPLFHVLCFLVGFRVSSVFRKAFSTL